jgi:hypothetical protein
VSKVAVVNCHTQDLKHVGGAVRSPSPPRPLSSTGRIRGHCITAVEVVVDSLRATCRPVSPPQFQSSRQDSPRHAGAGAADSPGVGDIASTEV